MSMLSPMPVLMSMPPPMLILAATRLSIMQDPKGLRWVTKSWMFFSFRRCGESNSLCTAMNVSRSRSYGSTSCSFAWRGSAGAWRLTDPLDRLGVSISQPSTHTHTHSLSHTHNQARRSNPNKNNKTHESKRATTNNGQQNRLLFLWRGLPTENTLESRPFFVNYFA